MKYKIFILSFASIVLIEICAFLVSISVNPTNTSSANAKREYILTSEITKETAVHSKSKIARQTLTFPNAKREKIKAVSFMDRQGNSSGITDK